MEIVLDNTDRALLALLQEDAGRPYAELAGAVGLSAAAVHDRVRKLRGRGVIRRTTVDVDPVALGRDALAFVLVSADKWVGDAATARALVTIPWVEEAHIVAGNPSLLLKIRASSTQDLQAVLRSIYEVDGVTGTESIVVLETLFERPVDPREPGVSESDDG